MSDYQKLSEGDQKGKTKLEDILSSIITNSDDYSVKQKLSAITDLYSEKGRNLYSFLSENKYKQYIPLSYFKVKIFEDFFTTHKDADPYEYLASIIDIDVWQKRDRYSFYTKEEKEVYQNIEKHKNALVDNIIETYNFTPVRLLLSINPNKVIVNDSIMDLIIRLIFWQGRHHEGEFNTKYNNFMSLLNIKKDYKHLIPFFELRKDAYTKIAPFES